MKCPKCVKEMPTVRIYSEVYQRSAGCNLDKDGNVILWEEISEPTETISVECDKCNAELLDLDIIKL